MAARDVPAPLGWELQHIRNRRGGAPEGALLLPISYYLAGISIGNGTKNAAIYCAIGSGPCSVLLPALCSDQLFFIKELAEALEGKEAGNISAIVYTQITDVELECDGIYTCEYRTHKQSADRLLVVSGPILRGCDFRRPDLPL